MQRARTRLNRTVWFSYFLFLFHAVFDQEATDYSILFMGSFQWCFSFLIVLLWVYLLKALFVCLQHNKFHSSFTRAYLKIGFIAVSVYSDVSLSLSSSNWADKSGFSFVFLSIAASSMLILFVIRIIPITNSSNAALTLNFYDFRQWIYDSVHFSCLPTPWPPHFRRIYHAFG